MPRIETDGKPWYVRGLGWFSLGLGVAELAAPGEIARLMGAPDNRRWRGVIRAIGARELAAGVGILARRRPQRWLWSRVVGDLMDLGVIAVANRGRLRAPRTGGGLLARLGQRVGVSRRPTNALPIALTAVAAVTALDVLASRRAGRLSSAASTTEPARGQGPFPLRASLTINRPREEVYAFWRQLENLPRFMIHLGSVRTLDRSRSHWTTAPATGRTVQWEAWITADRENQLIAWESLPGSGLVHAGEVRFVPAPGDHGTEVHLSLRVDPLSGMFGKAAVKLLHKVPEQLLVNDLRRLKQILETGEIMRSDASIHVGPHPARPSADGAATAPWSRSGGH